MKRLLKYWLPVVFWAGFIFFASSLPGDDIPSLFRGQDIIFHIFEYALLALLLNRAFKNSGPRSLAHKPRRLLLVFLSCLAYAVSDELHQQLISGRVSSAADVFMDSLGIILGSLIYHDKN